MVSHKGSTEALRGARVYLSILLGTSIGLQLLGIIWIYFSVGTLDFVKKNFKIKQVYCFEPIESLAKELEEKILGIKKNRDENN